MEKLQRRRLKKTEKAKPTTKITSLEKKIESQKRIKPQLASSSMAPAANSTKKLQKPAKDLLQSGRWTLALQLKASGYSVQLWRSASSVSCRKNIWHEWRSCGATLTARACSANFRQRRVGRGGGWRRRMGALGIRKQRKKQWRKKSAQTLESNEEKHVLEEAEARSYEEKRKENLSSMKKYLAEAEKAMKKKSLKWNNQLIIEEKKKIYQSRKYVVGACGWLGWRALPARTLSLSPTWLLVQAYWESLWRKVKRSASASYSLWAIRKEEKANREDWREENTAQLGRQRNGSGDLNESLYAEEKTGKAWRKYNQYWWRKRRNIIERNMKEKPQRNIEEKYISL